ncbi:hypothetical protein BCR33DRAFT_767604 [Rhizoclosmatium globosum]|uniref:Uncharacterized protein n=1 Tax=Rhizoclosmatium globosum TaxID=329046 RepID=A0A1Y2C2Q1_9FUNG|nr:hypothetical protein BCR33DRAFT_767604 [Rhizoclosmatium globosum]|eukprot:ORY41299.1 hypothetical protein BCR33DRAFT_767604 [Rhizoclosmatium globosum]
MAKAKKGGGKGKKKGGKKKGKKKLKVKIISYWDRKACPIFTGPWTFQGKTGDEAQQAFEVQAAAIREKLKFEKENTYVCLRVRQIEIDAHDFYITLPKDCPLQRLQIEICKRQHLGSVLPMTSPYINHRKLLNRISCLEARWPCYLIPKRKNQLKDRNLNLFHLLLKTIWVEWEGWMM